MRSEFLDAPRLEAHAMRLRRHVRPSAYLPAKVCAQRLWSLQAEHTNAELIAGGWSLMRGLVKYSQRMGVA